MSMRRRTSSRLSAKSEVLSEHTRDEEAEKKKPPSHPKKRRKQTPDDIAGHKDSSSSDSNPYEPFFANAVAQLHSAVIKRLRNTDIDKVTRSCAEFSVTLLDEGQTGITLSGDWDMLHEARRRILEILHPPRSIQSDCYQEGLQTSDEDNTPRRTCATKHVSKTHPLTRDTDKDLATVGKPNQFLCEYCPITFSDLKELTKHMTIDHGEQERKDLKDHENVHIGQEPYSCNFSGKSFWAQCHVRKHVQSHKKTTPQCLICKKRFIFKAGLTTHMAKHIRSGKHRRETYRKVYKQRQTLKRHICKGGQQTHNSDRGSAKAAKQLASSNKATATMNLIGELSKLSEGTKGPPQLKNAGKSVGETTRRSNADYRCTTEVVTLGDGATSDDSRKESTPLIVSLPPTESNVTSPPPTRRTTRSSHKPKPATTQNALSCSLCLQNFRTKAELVKHKRFQRDSKSGKQPLEPKGELTEVSKLSTTEFKVMTDTQGIRWYECRVCRLAGTRRFRMAAHFRVSHTENGGVPFNIIPKPSEEENSVSGQRTTSLDESLDAVEQSGTASTDKISLRRPPKLSRIQLTQPERATEECHKCGYKSSVAGLRNHMRTQHTKYLYQCQVCSKSFSTLFALRSHYRCHSDDNLGTDGKIKVEPEFTCEKCGKSFNRNVDLVHHKKLGASCSDKPPNPKQYNPPFSGGKYLCEVCGYSALQRVHVVQHHARRHAPRDFHCDQCSMSFAYERDLNNHRNVSHVEQKDYKCEICGKCFASSKYLNTHQQRHEKVKKHFCPLCNKGFLEKYRMTQHMETHKAVGDRQKPFSCRVCSKGFTTNSYRNDHENIHSGRQPYSCKECGKTLKAQCHMWKHMQLHHSDKTHACPVCGKTFRFKAGLTAHMVIHTRSGQHRCEACGKVYTQRQTLQRHVCKSGTVSTAHTTPGETNNIADTTPEVYVQNTPDTHDINTAGIYTQGITDNQDLSTAIDIEQEPCTQQNVYMCSECSDIFYDWNEVNDHLLTHTAAMTNTQALMEVGDDGNFTIQVMSNNEDSVAQSDETNTAVVDTVDSHIMQHVGQDVTSAALSLPDITQTVSGDIQSDIVSVSDASQNIAESHIMGTVAQDTQANVLIVSGVTQGVGQDGTSVMELGPILTKNVIQDAQSAVISVPGTTQIGSQNTESPVVSMSDMTPSAKETSSSVEGVPNDGIETAAEDWSILVNAPLANKQLQVEGTETDTPIVFIDTQSTM